MKGFRIWALEVFPDMGFGWCRALGRRLTKKTKTLNPQRHEILSPQYRKNVKPKTEETKQTMSRFSPEPEALSVASYIQEHAAFATYPLGSSPLYSQSLPGIIVPPIVIPTTDCCIRRNIPAYLIVSSSPGWHRGGNVR